MFASGGLTDDDVTDVGWHALAGVRWRGALESRRADVLGFLVSHAGLSRAAGFARDETAFELHYRIQATRFLAVQPVVHYIVDPSGRNDIGDAWVGMLRVSIDF